MNTKKILSVVLIAALLLLVSGCGKKEPQTAKLALPSNPTTGYTWEAEQTEPIFDITSEFVQDEAEEGMVGVGGTDVFVLTPKEKGETKVTFEYGQHWEGGETASTVTYEIEVGKNLQIKVLSMTGSLPGDADTLPEVPELEIS